MNKTELSLTIREYLAPRKEVDGEAAEGIKLLRLAEIALMQPDLDVGEKLDEARKLLDFHERTGKEHQALVGELDILLNGENGARLPGLADIVHQMKQQPEGKLLGYVTEEYAAQLLHGDYDAMSADIVETSDNLSQLAIYDRPRITPALIDADDFASQFVTQLRHVLQFDGSNDDLMAKCVAFVEEAHQQKQAIIDRDQQISSQDKLIGAVLDAAGQEWTEIDNLPIRVAQLRKYADDKRDMVHFVSTGGNGFAQWANDAIDLAHAVVGNLSPENRIMAKAAKEIILNAPRQEAE